MNGETVNQDQTDEGILTYDVSDEQMEAAAGTEWPKITLGFTYEGPRETPCRGCG